MKSFTLRASGALVLSLLIAGCSGGGSNNASETVSVLLSPTTVQLEVGKTQTFKGSVAGTSNSALKWSIEEGTNGGTITQEGVYKAPTSTGTFHVIATSVADTTKKATATVKVIAAAEEIQISISPSELQLNTGVSRTLTAIVTGTSNTQVSWTVQEGPSGGSITSGGVYTAPQITGVFHVIAASVANPDKTAAITVTVVEPAAITVTLTPAGVTLKPNATQVFNATVAQTEQTGVTWTIEEGNAGGTISTTGTYTAPATNGTYHVIATSVVDIDAFARAEVIVSDVQPITVSIAPNPATVQAGSAVTLVATVTNSSNVGVTWSVVEGSTGGTVSSLGKYTAPWTVGTYHVKATSKADATKSATVDVVVTTPVVAITMNPTTAAVAPLKTQSFRATVTGAQTTTVTWSVQEGAAGGTVGTTGLYTAPATLGTYHVIATSVADPTKTAVATVSVVSAGPFTFSGTIAYPGTRSGRCYVYIYDPDGNLVGGTTTAGPGPFTVRGVKGVGDFEVDVFMDTQDRGVRTTSVDPFGYESITVAGVAPTGIAVLLDDQTAPSTVTAPSSIAVTPGPGGAFVTWGQSGTSLELAEKYTLYWSTSANPGPTNFTGSLTVTSGTRFAVVTGLTNGTSYYFGVDASVGTLRSTVKASAAVPVAANTGGSTVNVALSWTGTVSANPFFVVLQGVTKTYFAKVTTGAGTSPLNVAVPNVAAGSYKVFYFKDNAANGVPDRLELNNLAKPAFVTAPAAAALPISFVAANANAGVTTERWGDDTGFQYYSDLRVNALRKGIANVALLSAPGITTTTDLPLAANQSWRSTTHDANVVPTTGGAYQVEITYTDGVKETLNTTMDTVIEKVSTPVSPNITVANTSLAPTFTWTTPASPVATWTQQVNVYDAYYGEYVWTSATLPMSATSAVYNADGWALYPELETFGYYYWWVTITDAKGNLSMTQGEFETP